MSSLSKFILCIFGLSLCGTGPFLHAMLTVPEVMAGEQADWEELAEHEIKEAQQATLLQSLSLAQVVELMQNFQNFILYGTYSEKIGLELEPLLLNQGLSEGRVKELLKEGGSYRAALDQLYKDSIYKDFRGATAREKKQLQLEAGWWQTMTLPIKLFSGVHSELSPEQQTALKEKNIGPTFVQRYMAQRKSSMAC